VFQGRVGISLYDAQYRLVVYKCSKAHLTMARPTLCGSTGTKAPIDSDTIVSVLTALARFKRTCEDFGVPTNQIKVLATEATREATNSADYRRQIHDATGWEVQMLPKEEEGRVGAMGVASSARTVRGLIMDLGGGSMQLTWMTEVDGSVDVKEGSSVSLPYGAAAVLRRLSEAQSKGGQAVDAFAHEIRGRVTAAWNSIKPAHEPRSFPLFLSGGGFRGWGNVLMDGHAIQPYPIPIINGFTVSPSSFRETFRVESDVAEKGSTIFRVSDRRATQIPAVAFLVTQLTAALPQSISRVRFAQGGVREGFLFSSLDASVRRQIPLEVATASHAPRSAESLATILRACLPNDDIAVPALVQDLVRPVINLLYTALSHPKEIRSATSLRLTTSGALAGVHGLSHDERAAMALMLSERWGGKSDLSPTDAGFFDNMQAIVSPEVAWWCRYVGRVGAVLGFVWPAGVVRAPEQEQLRFRATVGGKSGKLSLIIDGADEREEEELAQVVGRVAKLGKKKNWIGGREGWGLKVVCLLNHRLLDA